MCIRDSLWPLAEPPRRWLRRPVPDALPGTTLSRFEQLAGFRYDRQRAGVRTTWGLFGVDNTYPQRLPRGLRLTQHARATRIHLSERYMPLLVTAFVDLPSPCLLYTSDVYKRQVWALPRVLTPASSRAFA